MPSHRKMPEIKEVFKLKFEEYTRTQSFTQLRKISPSQEDDMLKRGDAGDKLLKHPRNEYFKVETMVL